MDFGSPTVAGMHRTPLLLQLHICDIIAVSLSLAHDMLDDVTMMLPSYVIVTS